MMQSSMAYYMLLLLGVAGVCFELINPGFILPGVLGFIALGVALYALHALPIYYLIVLGVILGAILVIGVKLALRSRQRPVQNGANMLMGALGHTLGLVDPRGQAFIHGEIWSVYSKHAIRNNCPIKVIAIKGICLEVEEQLNEGEI
ncbi:MAG: NfeD family protein [Legionellaceae bacterium]|nr:NfeD family protein [Legionellaceae bacterium]